MRTLLLLLSLAAPALFAAEPEIHALNASSSRGRISVSFELTGAFDRRSLLQGLQSGVPSTLIYEIELIRKRHNWFDDRLAKAQIEVIATFNGVTREYLVNYRRNHRLVRSGTVQTLSELAAAMTLIAEPELFLVTRDPSKLRIRVRAHIAKRFILYVVPNSVRTSWRQTRVRSVD